MEKAKNCSHKNSYFFHDNAPMYCPDCGKYLDGGFVLKNIITRIRKKSKWMKKQT